MIHFPLTKTFFLIFPLERFNVYQTLNIHLFIMWMNHSTQRCNVYQTSFIHPLIQVHLHSFQFKECSNHSFMNFNQDRKETRHACQLFFRLQCNSLLLQLAFHHCRIPFFSTFWSFRKHKGKYDLITFILTFDLFPVQIFTLHLSHFSYLSTRMHAQVW